MSKKINVKSHYADGFLLVVPKRNMNAYKRMAQAGAKIWREFGAIDYKECAGDDLNIKWGLPYTKLMKTKPSETIVFSWITFRSRKHRDSVNAKVMKDPRLAKMMDMKKMPFDMKRMSYGGFKIIVGF
jgi:uncharacterized protein YbaA (DUF1428 family)